MFFNLTGQFYRHATEISNKRNTVKNLNWQEADQLGRVTKRDRGFEVGTTEKQKSRWWHGGCREPGNSGLQHQRPKAASLTDQVLPPSAKPFNL